MNIGDYVRTHDGYIAKCIGKNKDKYVLGKHYNFDGTIRDVRYQEIDSDDFLWEEELNEIEKTSPNIIDLIEVGDYVNGWRVNRVEREEDGTILTCGTITSFVSRSEKDPYLTQDYKEADKICKLKSIVTKEQFEQMEYKIKE